MESLPLSLNYIRQVVVEYFANKPVRRGQVFGSYARGEATAESDLDLLVELARSVGWYFTDYADDLGVQLGIRVDAGTTVSDYIMRYIQKDLITLYEPQQKQAA